LKDLAFELSVPADPAFRPLAADAAGKYGETLGLSHEEAASLTVSVQGLSPGPTGVSSSPSRAGRSRRRFRAP
jgi:hypothetical protein